MSLAYLTLKKECTRSMTEAYFERQRATEEERKRETEAIVDIQRVWRGYNARKYIEFLNLQATDIKRVWRGYKGRERAKDEKANQITQAETDFFGAMATNIQKVWRGYYSRKRIQDFYARKKYVEGVTQNSELLQRNIAANLAQERLYQMEQQNLQESQEFMELTAHLHHLLGTNHIPGVFTSPYGEEFATTAYGQPMEDHIKHAFKVHRKESRNGRSRGSVRTSSRGHSREAQLRSAPSTMKQKRPKARGKGRELGVLDSPKEQALNRTQQRGRYQQQQAY